MLYADPTAGEDAAKAALAKIDEQIAYEQRTGDTEKEGQARWQRIVTLKNFSLRKKQEEEAGVQMEWFDKHGQ